VTRRFPGRTLALAFAVAALADGLSFFLALSPPLQWALEAIPGLGIVPFWVLVVGAVAVWGTPRPSIKSFVASGKALRGAEGN
jgi:hypothetical protein